MQNGRFYCKIALHLNEVCYKVSLCEYCQRLSCEVFIGLTIRAKNDSRGTSSTTWKFCRNWPTPFKNADFQSIFARSASAV